MLETRGERKARVNSEGGLKREIGVGTATGIVIANMIGTGIFTTTGLLLGQVESGWLVMTCWIVGGLVALAGALSYAELATMMPRSGGEYVFLREIYGPLPAFLTGWISFFAGFSAPAAATAVASAEYLAAAGVLPATALAKKTAAFGIVAALTAAHYCGLRVGATLQNVLTLLKLSLLGVLLFAGFAMGSGTWNFMATGSGFWAGGNAAHLGITMLLVMFAYSGWNAAAYIGEEVKEPARTLPRALALGTLTVMVIYLALNLLFFFAVPADALRDKVAVGEVAARALFGEGAARGLSVLIAAGLLASLSAYVLIGPRVYFAMARDGLFFKFAANIHPRFETPSFSIAAQGACAALMLLTGSFEDLLTYIGFALGIFPWMAVLGVILLRRRESNRERTYRVWGYPLTPLFYLAVMATVMGVAFANRPVPSAIALATVAAGAAVYWICFVQLKKGN